MAMVVVSTKAANIIALGGGIVVFIITAAITVYMTSEYNKAKNYQKLKLLFQSLNNDENYMKNWQEDRCKLCQFPFKYQGKTYKDCIADHDHDQYWCPNLLDESGSYIEGQRIDCPVNQCRGCKTFSNF